jgi:hypothetical protein
MPNGAIPAENSDLSGVYITGGSQSNLLQNNIIAYHTEYGIKVDAEIGYLGLSCEAYFNTFTRNRIYANGKLGIYLKSGVCGETTYRPNQNIQPPTLTNVNTTQAFGTTCPNCVVEVFISDKTSVPDPENAGEGKVFVGSSTADGSGNFLVVLGGVSIGQVLTATTTDGSGNTSMFANNVLVTTAGPVIDPTPPPPPPPPGNGNHQRFLPFIHK